MLIDWFTVGAQALNFVILAWLMKRFLYKPVLDAIDAREQRISSELAAAAAKNAEAMHALDALHRKTDAFDQQRAALLKTATDDAGAARQRMMDAARQAADALAAKRQAALASDATALVQGVRQRAQTEVFAIARKALMDVAGASLDASACALFIARLQALEGPPRDALAAALRGASETVVVRSAFELPGAQRQAIEKAIADTFGVKPALRYDSDPALVAGIELMAQGQKVAWTIAEYLDSLEHGVSELLQARAREHAAAPVPVPVPVPALAPAPAPAPAPKPAAAAVSP